MLAVFTGLGQRETLLIPLTKLRQPSITRSAASLIAARVVGSNRMLLCVAVQKFCCNIVGAIKTVNCVMPAQGAEPRAYYFAFVTAHGCKNVRANSGLALFHKKNSRIMRRVSHRRQWHDGCSDSGPAKE